MFVKDTRLGLETEFPAAASYGQLKRQGVAPNERASWGIE